MMWASSSKAMETFIVSPNAQSKIASPELAWTYHMSEHALSLCSFHCFLKQDRVVFPESKIVTIMSYGQAKEEILITDVLVSYSITLG